jgi:hypothetical protein
VLAVDAQGTLWAGSGCTLWHWDGQLWRDAGGCDALQGSILDLAFTPSGDVWAASGMRLARYDGRAWSLYDRLVSSVAVAPDGSLWVAGWKGTQGSDYIARFDGAEWEEYPGSRALLAVTADGWVWGIDPGQGLVRFDGQDWAVYSTPSEVDPHINRLLEAPDGSLWMTDNANLARLEGSTWQVFPGAAAGALALAPDATLWLGTSNGAVHFDPRAVGP